jgi:hypothetical protein
VRGVARYVPRLIPLDYEGERKRIAELLDNARRNPKSVRWSVEELEAVAAWLALEPSGPDESVRASVGLVLADPQKAFASGTSILELDLRVAPDLLADAYIRWLLDRASEADRSDAADGSWTAARRWIRAHGTSRQDDPRSRALSWFLRHADTRARFPVGSSCPELQDGFPASAARELMPFEGVEYASVVIPVGRRGGALLCMFRPSGERYVSGGKWDTELGISASWKPDGRRVEVMPVPKRSIPIAMQQGVRRWWRTVNGLPGRAGRTPGPSYWTAERIVDALITFRKETCGAPKSRDAFVKWACARAEYAIKDSQAGVIGDRWSRQLQLSFSEVRDAIAVPSGDILIVEVDPG